jgi:hypothetical protein
MLDPMSDKHYESRFTFPLLKLIKERAIQKDISYHDATLEVMPEYIKTIRYGDIEFEDALIKKYEEETREAEKRWQKMLQSSGKGG